jgi:hypothetical protein
MSPVVVVVNGESYTAAELLVDGPIGSPAVPLTLSAPRLGIRLVDAIDRILVGQRGKDLGFALEDEQYQEAVKHIGRENHLHTDEAFRAALEAMGLSEAAFRRNLEQEMVRRRMQMAVTRDLTIGEDEIRTYYVANRHQFPISSLEQARSEIQGLLLNSSDRPAREWQAVLESLRVRAAIDWRSQDLWRAYVDALMAGR